ncbi:MAG: hypothetical protein JW781_01885 [Deltaproteobacteria bacterium]|nr:hypothetical protein [Candidatus Anaeroferrophillacea bacterium]
MHEHHHHHEHGHCGACAGAAGTEAKSFTEKLDILLSHWIDHNESHQDDYRKWAAQAQKENREDLVEYIKAAMERFREGNDRLRQAKQILEME